MALTKITGEGLGTSINSTNTSGNSTVGLISGTSNSSVINLGDTDASNVGQVKYHHGVNSMVLRTNSTDKITLDSTGNMLFNQSGTGVYLGVTSATAANLLDDYEEGTFTPTWAGYPSSKINSTSGKYVKVGNQVTVYIKLVTGTDSDASTVSVNNLPFTISGDSGAGSIYHNTSGLRDMHIVTRFNSNSTTCLLDGVLSGSDTTIKYVGTSPALGGSSTLIWILHYQTI